MNVLRLSAAIFAHVLLLFGSVACTRSLPPPPSPPAITVEPLSIDVADEFNDGRQLSVLATVKAAAPVRAADVLLRLSGLAAGQIVRSQDFRLTRDTASQEVLAPGEERKLALFLDSEGLSDYQLEMFWGDSALKLRPRAKPDSDNGGEKAIRLKNLVVQRIRVPCTREYCAMKFQVQGEMLNEGALSLDHVVVGVSIARVGDQESPEAAEEVRLELPAVGLKPGELRPLVIDIDREIPEKLIDAYQPKVRIVEFR